MKQRTDDWFAARAGLLTGSRAAAIANGIKSATAQKLLWTLAWERTRGICAPTYCNNAMQRGTDLEPEARQAYEIEKLCVVEEVGFIVHPDHPFIGISPDGLVGDNGMVEIKCPDETSAHLHLQHIVNGYYAKQYKHQVNLQLAVTGREWCDVVSYYPIDGETQPLAVHRVERDEDAIEKLVAACVEANAAIEKIINTREAA